MKSALLSSKGSFMPRQYPPLTPEEVIRILRARGFVWQRIRSSHEFYRGVVRERVRNVTVDRHYPEFDPKRIRDMLDQSGLTREEFYGSTKESAHKIGLRADVYPIPLK